MPLHLALLRGINVGGRHRLPMADLAAAFAAAGARDVRTYIQSGNVVYRARAADARRIPARVAAALAARLGFAVPVVGRTIGEWRAVVRGNPFLHAGADPDACHVACLADRPAVARVGALDPDRSAPDRFAVRGREVYLHLPNGVARTRLTNAWLDAQLGTVSTLRNWRTVCALLALAEA